MILLLDTNVVIDVLTADPSWSGWSTNALSAEVKRGRSLAIDEIVYAEVSAFFDTQRSLDIELAALSIELHSVTLQALYAAGRAFASYRHRGGPRSTILPDFIIGAHAADLNVPLVTRDVRRYRTYFPDLTLITP
jgi:predicted nucleic acid-binding protein